MKLFGRKKKKDEEDFDEESEDIEKEKVKRRREPSEPKKTPPPKPWGKRERYILIIFIAITILPSAVLALSSRSWKIPGLPRVQFPKLSSISLNFFSEDIIVLEADSRNSKKAAQGVLLIESLTEKLTGVYGVYVLNLSDGFSYGVNENELFEPASLNKLPVMYTAYRLSSDGQLNLDTEYTLKGSDKVSGSGVLSSQAEGKTYTYQDLLNLMGKHSDNTAYLVMKSVVGDDEISKTLDLLGVDEGIAKENNTTPKDIARIFHKLDQGLLLDVESKETFINSLVDTEFESWLVSGIPSEVKVGHKFGRETNVLNDAGIIYANKPYVLVILSKGIESDEANQALVEISQTIYNNETSLKY